MLPYTTYQIPEPIKNQEPSGTGWLWMIFRGPLSDTERDLIHKISVALQADFDKDVCCLYTSEEAPLSLAELSKPAPKLVLSFGVPPSQTGLWIDLTKPGIITLEAFTYILTLSADALANNAGAKKELWMNMKLYLESA